MSGVADLGRSPFLRVLLLGALVLILQVPVWMVGQLAKARQAARDEAAAELSRTWGGRQDVLGPFLVVPWRTPGATAQGWQVNQASGHLVLLPERLEIRADAAVEPRRRGIFELPVYRSTLRMSGRFRAPKADAAALDAAVVPQWGEAQLVLRLADVHAIDHVAPLKWNGADIEFQPGGGELGAGGLHAGLAASGDAPAQFAITLELRGSQGLYFVPAGRDTVVQLHSAWPHPAFQGAWLPKQREVGPLGFDASWEIPNVARGLPPAWKLGALAEDDLRAALFGADFLYPVDPYRMSERSLKYSTLFIGLTFLVIWLFEVLARAPVHPVQYLLLGAALCLFYLLELSLAEHLGFAAAYGIASLAVTLQMSLYCRAALSGWRPALTVFSVVASLYGLLYLLLREEDDALLLGSASLFAILSAVMFLTRRVQWGRSGEALANQLPA